MRVGQSCMDTQTREFQIALSDAEVSYSQFRALANSIPNLAWMADPDGWVFWYNQRWYDYTGTTPEEMVGWGWQSVHKPEHLPEMLERWTGALSAGTPFEMTFPLRRGSDGSYRMFVTRAEPLREDGHIVGWFGTNTDITEQEQTRERLQLVINELNHRVKNTLATVQSIAFNTFKSADRESYDTFEKRLLSLSLVHDALSKGQWSRMPVADIVELALTIFDRSRFDVTGEEVTVEARCASAMAMTLHELATNAVKYGSLSGPSGTVSINWNVELSGSRAYLHMRWQESGGPKVHDPERLGFGVRLIRKAMASDSGASVEHTFEADGVRCEFRLPIDDGVLR